MLTMTENQNFEIFDKVALNFVMSDDDIMLIFIRRIRGFMSNLQKKS